MGSRNRFTPQVMSIFCLGSMLGVSAGCSDLVKDTVQEATEDVATGVSNAMDEAFVRLDQLQVRTAERRHALEIEKSEGQVIRDRLSRLEVRSGTLDAALQKAVAQANAHEKQAEQQLPLLWKRLGERTERLDSRLGDGESRLDSKIDTEAANLRRQIDGDVRRLEVRLDNATSRLDDKIESDTAILQSSLDQQHVEIESKLSKLQDRMDEQFTKLTDRLSNETKTLGNTLREERRDLLYLVGAIVGIGTLVVTIISAARSRRGEATAFAGAPPSEGPTGQAAGKK